MARSAVKQQAILAAAITEFKSNGFENTSMDQIALAASVSKRTVYNHFPSKELLFDAMLEKMISLFNSAVFVEYQDDKPISDQLTDIARQEIALLSDNAFIDLVRVLIAESIHSPERINKALAEVQNRDGDLVSWLNKANAAGKLAVDNAAFASAQFFALIKAFCFWPQVVQGQPFPDPIERRKIIDSAVSMFINQYSR
ncbi:TetR/AcrR family transcriptional regulator [Catenovulum adriaticum]|uniref:TetR/AcrR family transcriptional regulator n=1 Tax=Catenovulum adriaticum TaxID=2984846 RepID=A0ABY7ATN0_9ALTE|nr:TetR/AcrR family transcriptional regulator [Catenovulum sp. TS8]WAJ72132.1 TetR/AcrR family transcriptional regulator [Catenovulum sp. TS8]